MESSKIQISINPFWLAKNQSRVISNTEREMDREKINGWDEANLAQILTGYILVFES